MTLTFTRPISDSEPHTVRLTPQPNSSAIETVRLLFSRTSRMRADKQAIEANEQYLLAEQVLFITASAVRLCAGLMKMKKTTD